MPQRNHPNKQIKKFMNKKFLIIASVLLLAAGCQTATVQQTQPQKPVQIIPPPKPKALITASTQLDSKGNAVNPRTIFSSKDSTIYVVVQLNRAKKNDKVSYARYYNGKYLNAQTTRIKSDNVNHVAFAFNKDKGYAPGQYSLKVFYNGKQFDSFNYVVK